LLNQQNLNHDGIYSCTGIYFFKSAKIKAPKMRAEFGQDKESQTPFKPLQSLSARYPILSTFSAIIRFVKLSQLSNAFHNYCKFNLDSLVLIE